MPDDESIIHFRVDCIAMAFLTLMIIDDIQTPYTVHACVQRWSCPFAALFASGGGLEDTCSWTQIVLFLVFIRNASLFFFFFL